MNQRMAAGRGSLAQTTVSLAASPLQELSQHIGENSAVTVVLDLDRRIDTDGDGEVLAGSVRTVNGQGEVLLGSEVLGFHADEVKGLGPVESQRIDGIPVLELAGQHAHADKVGSVDSFETGSDYGSNSLKSGSFGRP